MAAIKNRIDPRKHDGHGTNSEPLMTGHGAPASASGRGNEPMPTGKILANNWGASRLKKMGPTVGASQPGTGQERFVRPIDSATAQIPPPGLGNPRGQRSMD